jgi:HD-like signal output (HDOD) protein/ActR/RegA family two-component response regulator
MKTVLFVDDEPQALEGLRVSLYARRKEWDMHFADGGAKAMELMRASRFDVLVSDLRMPGIDGTVLLAWTRTNSPDTIRIVLTGYANEENSRQLVSIAHRYLCKPCEPKQLEECIDACLATRALIQSDALRTRLGSVGTLPPMPATFAALQLALADPTTDSSKIAAIVQKDTAIAAKVLQTCNSAFFRLPRRVTSIRQAVSHLGLSTVRSMVLSAELFNAGQSVCAAIDLGQLQRHALSVATLARSLMDDATRAEEAFLVGLLHDVGFLLLGRLFKDEMQLVLEASVAGMALAEAERKFVGVDHGTAGAYLLGLWGLPFEVVEAVAQHEDTVPVARTSLDVMSAIRVAHALLSAIRPIDLLPYEQSTLIMDDDELRRIGVLSSWKLLVQRSSLLLDAAEAA